MSTAFTCQTAGSTPCTRNVGILKSHPWGDTATCSSSQRSPDRSGEISHDRPGSAAAMPHVIGISTPSQWRDRRIQKLLDLRKLRCPLEQFCVKLHNRTGEDSKVKLETDLARIREIAKQKEDQNWRFRSFLKGYDGPARRIDSIVHDLYQRISAEIDCKQCANCCREIQPVLNQKDIRAFSRGLGLPVNEFKTRYLVQGDTPQESLFKQVPCPFLKGNLCSNYEHRPQDCRSFPHLHKRDFTTRLLSVVENCSVCPIVFNVYEYLKDELWQGRYRRAAFL